MSKSPPPIFDALPLNTLFNSFVSALEAVNLITGAQVNLKNHILVILKKATPILLKV